MQRDNSKIEQLRLRNRKAINILLKLLITDYENNEIKTVIIVHYG